MKTPVEFLAEKYNYITWLRNRDEISASTADEWREKFLKEAKEMENQYLKNKRKSTKRCHCGAEFDGIECYSCGFDATEIDIY